MILCGALLIALPPAANPASAQSAPAAPRPAARRPAPAAAPQAARPAAIEPAPNEFGIEAAARHLQLRDDLVAPLVHSGFAPGIAVAYTYRGEEHRHDARFGFAMGSPTNRFDQNAQTYAFEASYGYGYRVYASEAPDWHLYTGARVGGAGDGAFFPLVDDAHAYWFTRYDVRPQAAAEFVIDPRSRASLSLAFPLFGLVSRPPATRLTANDKPDFGNVAATFHQDLRLRTLDSYQGLDVGVAYRYRVTRTFSESIEYRFAYASAAEPRPVQVLTHSLRVGLHLDPWKW